MLLKQHHPVSNPMARTKDPYVAERNSKICEAFRQDPNRSNKSLASEFGVSDIFISKVLRQAGLIERGRSGRRVQPENLKPQTPFLGAIAAIIDNNLRVHQETHSLDNRLLSQQLSINLMLLMRMRRGHHDFTITEIEKFCKYMKIQPDQLMKDAITLVQQSRRGSFGI